MTNEETKELCLALMRVDDEEGVVELLTEAGLWDDPACWRHLGDNENNFSTIGNQQSSEEAALVEKLVNAIDARLVNACQSQGVDPESDRAPQTVIAAVARFFDDTGNAIRFNAGRVSNWPDRKRTEEGRLITLATTGAKPPGRASVTVADEGEGQTPDDFPDTFCSLLRSNKLKIPFVQGKYNMGGTGALQFCGKHNLQLIVSRRNPALSTMGGANCDKWGFTIIRRDNPAEGRRLSVYSYLAPIKVQPRGGLGSVLMFTALTMPIFPEISGKGSKSAYSRHSEYGSLVKLYEYLKGSNIIQTRGGLLRQIDLLLPDVALPIRLYECRAFKGRPGSFETNITGLGVRLEDDKASNIEPEFPSSATIRVAGHKMTVLIYAFTKDNAVNYRMHQGVVFTINGQTHGHLPADFFRRKRTGMSYLADSLLLLVDCNDIDLRAREDLFMNSRDRLRRNELESKIESELERLLSHHSGLVELRNRRRQEQISEKLTDSKPLREILTSIIRNNEALKSILLAGKQIPNPFVPKTVGKTEDFEGKRNPTYFRFRNQEYGYILSRKSPINQRPRILFETDVENAYFSRDLNPGEVLLDVSRESGHSLYTDFTLNLHNGVATLNVRLPDEDEVNEGDVLLYKLVIKDETLVSDLKNEFQITLLPAKESSDYRPSGPRKPPAGEKEGNERDAPSGLDIPKVEKIKEADWESQDPPFNKFTALRVKHAGQVKGVDTYDYKINVDNLYLKSEQKQSKDSVEILESRFTVALILLALALFQDEHHTEEIKEEDVSTEMLDAPDLEKRVENFTRAVAPFVLPMIDGLSSISIPEPVSTGDTLGN